MNSQSARTSIVPPRVRRLLGRLKRSYPRVDCELSHSSALELLVATILSAQCTDVRVNQVTPALFRRFHRAEDYAAADPADLQALIRPTGFFRSKARNIQGAARLLVDRHGGRVPSTMEELLELPGVARKTANVVLGTWFGRAEGVVVDTHVSRLSGRLGLTRQTDPVKIEADLMAILPKREWIGFSHRMIRHGRRVCVARSPRCPECPLQTDCPSVNMFHVKRGRGE